MAREPGLLSLDLHSPIARSQRDPVAQPDASGIVRAVHVGAVHGVVTIVVDPVVDIGDLYWRAHGARP